MCVLPQIPGLHRADKGPSRKGRARAGIGQQRARGGCAGATAVLRPATSTSIRMRAPAATPLLVVSSSPVPRTDGAWLADSPRTRATLSNMTPGPRRTPVGQRTEVALSHPSILSPTLTPRSPCPRSCRPPRPRSSTRRSGRTSLLSVVSILLSHILKFLRTATSKSKQGRTLHASSSLRRRCPCLEVQCMTDQAQAPSLATRS